MTLDDQLVVYLQNQARVKTRCGQLVFQLDHGSLDDVGSGALDRAVHRDALTEGDQHLLRCGQLGDITAASEQRRDVAVLLCDLDDVLQICGNRGIGL